MSLSQILGAAMLVSPVVYAFWRGYRAGILKPMLEGAVIGIFWGSILLVATYLLAKGGA